MSIETITRPDGMRYVTMPAEEYQDLVDSRDAAVAMRAVEAGILPTVPDDAMDDFLAATTPLAFWRRHRGITQFELAAAAGISQPYLAQLEGGSRQSADIGIYQKLARRLGVRIEDLLAE